MIRSRNSEGKPLFHRAKTEVIRGNRRGNTINQIKAQEMKDICPLGMGALTVKEIMGVHINNFADGASGRSFLEQYSRRVAERTWQGGRSQQAEPLSTPNVIGMET